MIYVCSDIHGCFARYKQVIDRLKDTDHLYIIGDIIDRGNYGIEIFLDVMKRDNVTVLLGNHEYMMYCSLALNMSRELYNWISLQNGGTITYDKFKKLDGKIQRRILEYIENMPLYVTIEENNKKYYLSHGSYIKPIYENQYATINDFDDEDIVSIVWHSPFNERWLLNYYDGYDVYIHGHKFVQRFTNDYHAMRCIASNDNRSFEVIDIDGGCACLNSGFVIATALILYNLSMDRFEYLMDKDD